MKSFLHYFLCPLMLFFAHQSIGQLTIAQARALGANAIVTTKGIVTNGAELGTIRYFQDETAGLAVYDFNYANQINRGDSILVTGTLVDYNGLLEISTVTNLQVLSSGNPLPQAQIFSPAEIGEDQEGELVRINDALFSAAGGTFAGNTTYPFTSNGQTLNIYVRNGSPLIGQMIPASATDMIGISSQYLTNYQILPRDSNDFVAGPGITITSIFTQTNLNYNGFSVNWTTNIPGSTGVRYGLTPALEMGNDYDGNPLTQHTYPIVDLEAGQIYYCQGYSVANGDTAFTPIRPFGTISNSSGNMLAYFNTPCDTSVAIQQAAVQLFEAIDDTLIAYLDRAEISIDLTIYDFNNTSISNISQAVNDAVDRGVVVRFISDGSMAPTNSGVTSLAAGVQHIYSPTGDAYNIMHNKFVVIDANHTDPLKPIVWTGSTNWTDRQINRDPNSVVIVQDQTLARAYTIEFNEMWGSNGVEPDTSNSKFGQFKTDNTPHQFIIGNKNVECYFSPSDNVNSQLVETIGLADNNAYFASMLITRQDIADSLISLHAAGGEVKGIIDNPSGGGSQYTLLQTELDSTELFVNPDTNVIMHHKFLITDHAQNLQADPTLWVGSHNWTASANTRNDENTLVIHDASLVNQYYQQLMYLISFEPITGCTISNACNYNPAATISDESCLFIAEPCDDGNPNTANDVVGFACVCQGVITNIVPGCTDNTACNFDNTATEDDGSCTYPGCTDIAACNYDSLAGCENGSCLFPGCTDPTACNFNENAACDDNSCSYSGCTDILACNFDTTAGCDDGSCVFPGCTDEFACNFDSLAGCDDGNCVFPGCTDATACNFDSLAGCDAGNCLFPGCTDSIACNFDFYAGCNDGSCVFPGCTDATACNFDSLAGCDAGNCLFPGCTDSIACNFDFYAGCDDGSCVMPGCTEIIACNYDSLALCDNGLCQFPGCVDSSACNFDSLAGCAENNSCVYSTAIFNCSGECIHDLDNDGLCDEFEIFSCSTIGACNYDSLDLNPDDDSCLYAACTNPTACNFSDFACVDLSLCVFPGCTDSTACNYDSTTTCDNGLCQYPGCIDDNACNFDFYASCDDSSCTYSGCTILIACNYNSLAGCDDGSCLFPGCIDAAACNYNPDAACDNESCTFGGCTNLLACNYDSLAGCENGSCLFPGCTDPTACNFNENAACDDNSCSYSGCTDTLACNFDTTAGCDDGSCVFPGCTDSAACNYEITAACDNGSCLFAEIYYDCEGNCLNDTDSDGICDQNDLSGCMDPNACNFNAFAITDDGSCTFPGCIDPAACNYQNTAGCDDGSCAYPGCTNPSACNYEMSAGCDDGSCLFTGGPCDDGNNNTYNDTIGNTCLCEGIVMVMGCTDSFACNYDALANTPDSSCQYIGDVCDDGDSTTTDDTLSVDCICQGSTVGLNETSSLSSRILVYPNPVEHHCTIELYDIRSNAAWVRLTDLAGNIVAQEKIMITQPYTLYTLDVSAASSGVYLLEVVGQSFAMHNKIVIN